MATETISQIYDILNDDIVNEVFNQFFHEALLLPYIKKKTTKGRQILLKHRLAGNHGSGFRSERATLPTAKARYFEETSLSTKYWYAAVSITGQEIYETEGKGAMIDVVMDALEDTYNNGLLDLNRVLWGDGSGRIAQVNGTPVYDGSTYTTITFDNGSPFHFFERMDVTFGTSSTAYEIVEVDIENKTIKVEGDLSTTVLDNDWIYKSGAYAASLDTEAMGLKGHISASNPPSGTYQGKDRTATGWTWLQAYEKDMAGAAISSLALTQFIDQIRSRGGVYPTHLFTEMGVRNSYVLLLQSENQPVEKIVDETGFTDKLKFIYAGRPLTLEVLPDAPEGSIYAFNADNILLYESKPLGWDTTEGNPKLARSSTTDVFEGRISWYFNTAGYKPKTTGVMSDIKRNSIT